MSPNSRPPLTSRIRSSFENKRSKSEVTSPTPNGFITQDPDALRRAIDQAINSETFLNSISANLANLIKPSIKTALDTIQPVVETVYNHEVLLRKTNQSVEDLLGRFDSAAEAEDGNPSSPATPRKRARGASIGSADIASVKQLLAENNTQLEAKLSELSKSVDTSNNKIVESVEGINAALYPTREALDSLKSSSGHSNTTMSVMQAQLDQLNADVGVIMDSIGSDLGNTVKAISQPSVAPDKSLLSSHTTKLDAISTDLTALKAHVNTVEILKDMSAKLEDLRNNVLAGIASSNQNFATITPQIGSVVTAVETHSTKLAEISPADSHAEVLAAIQKSNDSHVAHSAALSEIKEMGVSSSGSESAPAISSSESTTALEALAKDLASVKEDIQVGFTTSNEHISSLGTKVDDVLTTLEAHRAADPSGDILAAVQKSNVSHASHAEALDAIKSIAPAPPTERSNSDLEPQFATIIAKLDTHSTALGDLKTSHVPSTTELTTVPTASNLDGIETQISLIADTLESHTAILNEIRDDVSAEILTVLHDINEAHSSQNNVLSEIRESDVSDEILTALHASNDSHTGHAAILADIHTAVKTSNDSHASHSGVLDEIKATKNIQPAVAVEGSSNLEALDTHIGTIISTLEDQNVALSAIKDATDVSNKSHLAHTAVLAEIRDAAATSNESHNSHSSVLTEVKSAVAASSDLHTGHTTALSEIKDIVSSSNDFHNSHTGILGELKETLTTTSESHASHSADLAEIKKASKDANDLHASHITALTELKASPPTGVDPAVERGGGDLGTLETHINAIISTLDTQNDTLCEIKEATASPEVLAAVKESHELLKSHTPLLKTIKDGQSQEDVLANLSDLKAIMEDSRAGIDTHGAAVKDLHESTKASHTDITHSIGALALGGVAGAGAEAVVSKDDDSSSKLLQEVKAVRAIVEKSSTSIETVKETTTSMAAQIDINHTTVTTSITTLSDELKAEVDATGTDIVTSIASLSGDVKGLDLGSLKNAVEESKMEVRGLSAVVDYLDGSVKSTGTHVAGLANGVHLNEKGVGQLKEHASSNISATHPPEAKQLVKEPTGQNDLAEAKSVTAVQEPEVVKGEPNPDPETPQEEESEIREPVEEEAIEKQPTPTAEPEAETSKEEPVLEDPTDKDPDPTPSLEEDEESALDTESASTSAIASPMSPSFPGESKKGKKGKKEKKEKKPKKDKKSPFVFDPDEEEEAA